MRAALVRSLDDVAVVTCDVPAIGPGEILVAMKAVGICGSDTTGWYVATKAPAVLGHEPAGVVAEAGDGRAASGRATASSSTTTRPAGRAALCLAGEDVQCAEWKKNRLDPGGLAEYVRVEAEAVATDVVPAPGRALLRGRRARRARRVRREGRAASARIRAGDTVAVIGLGANGVMLGLVAREAGAATPRRMRSGPGAARAMRCDSGSTCVRAPEKNFLRR